MGEIKSEVGLTRLEERILDLKKTPPSRNTVLQSVFLPEREFEDVKSMATVYGTTAEVIVAALIRMLNEDDASPLDGKLTLLVDTDETSRTSALDEVLHTLGSAGSALREEVGEMRTWLIDLDTRLSGTARSWNEARASIQGLLHAEAVNGG